MFRDFVESRYIFCRIVSTTKSFKEAPSTCRFSRSSRASVGKRSKRERWIIHGLWCSAACRCQDTRLAVHGKVIRILFIALNVSELLVSSAPVDSQELTLSRCCKVALLGREYPSQIGLAVGISSYANAKISISMQLSNLQVQIVLLYCTCRIYRSRLSPSTALVEFTGSN